MAITFVASTVARGPTAAASTTSIVPRSSQAPGNAFIVAVSAASTTVIVSTMTDNVGNVFRKVAQHFSSAVAAIGGIDLWYATNISTGSTRISVTRSGNSTGSLFCATFNGLSTGTALQSSGSSHSTAASSVHNVVSITPPTDNQLVVVAARHGDSTTVLKPGTNFSTLASQQHIVAQYWIQGAATGTDGPWTINTGNQRTSVIASFSDTVAGGPGPTFLWSPSMLLTGVQ